MTPGGSAFPTLLGLLNRKTKWNSRVEWSFAAKMVKPRIGFLHIFVQFRFDAHAKLVDAKTVIVLENKPERYLS
jgi:hypothetical protein